MAGDAGEPTGLHRSGEPPRARHRVDAKLREHLENFTRTLESGCAGSVGWISAGVISHPGPVPATAAPPRRGHTRGAAAAPGTAGGAAGHRVDHRPPSNLDPDDAARLQAIRARCPELDSAVRHVAGFARMIKDLSGDENTLTKWMGAVDADLPALRSFTTGLRRDPDAVVAGLTMGYNSGAVEGTVNRIKQLKTAMHGRAKPDLLRKRILLA